jgi:glycosyltransferase involved in cell wall biosynthesis
MIPKTEQEIMQNWQGDIAKPVVSVCTITYNHVKYIAEAIDSFLMQETNFPFEIVIGEDCSTDDTRKIIEEYATNYPNIIKLITSENNVGMQQNGQRTMNACTGEYIAFCEGDDYWTDTKKLQIQIDEMKKYPNIDISFHLASTVNKINNEIKPQLQEKTRLYTLKEIITGEFHLVQSNTIVLKKKKIESLNYDLLSKSPVGDVWIRVNASMPNGALFINKIMSTYRIQSSGSWSSSMYDENKFIQYVINMIKSIDSFDKYWDFQYTSEFLIYKNMFIETVVKKDICKNIKNNFINNHKNLMSYKNLILWYMLYKYPFLVKYLKSLKRIIKG